MTYGIHQYRSPQRQVPLIQPAARIFGLSQADRLRNALQVAEQHRVTLRNAHANHCAALGRANAVPPSYRRDAKRRAFQYINLTRAALRANAHDIARLQAGLLALDALAEVV